jgi:RHS repeat-associated protein
MVLAQPKSRALLFNRQADCTKYTYDNANQLLTARDGQGAYTFTYDSAGQVQTQKDVWGDLLTFTFDAVGNRTKVQDNFSGLETSTYDAANNLSARKFSGIGGSSLRLEFTYTATNELQNAKRYNASSGGSLIGQTTYTYDNALRLTNIKNADGSGTQLSLYSYTYDNANRLIAEQLGGGTTSYSYDAASQLTNDGVNSYGYDAAGNRNNSGQTISTGNHLTADANWNYTYDDEGNLTRKVSVGGPTVTWTYAWDNKNRLTDVHEAGGGNEIYTGTYTYDVFNNRISAAEDADGAGAGAAVTTRFALEGMKVQQDAWQGRQAFVGLENWDVWADLDGSNNLKIRYERGNAVDELFSRVKSDGTVAWYLTDRMGSMRQMTDAAGAVQDTIAYDGFGKITSESNASFGDRWKWTGREFNSTTGLQYNRARYFSNNIGRWMNDDPIRYNASDYNMSRYSHGSSINRSDPNGLDDLTNLEASALLNSSPFPPGIDPFSDFVARAIDARIQEIINQPPQLPPAPPIRDGFHGGTKQSVVDSAVRRLPPWLTPKGIKVGIYSEDLILEWPHLPNQQKIDEILKKLKEKDKKNK